jgi:hypothetical protein
MTSRVVTDKEAIIRVILMGVTDQAVMEKVRGQMNILDPEGQGRIISINQICHQDSSHFVPVIRKKIATSPGGREKTRRNLEIS